MSIILLEDVQVSPARPYMCFLSLSFFCVRVEWVPYGIVNIFKKAN
jgi:hypothetical protein